MIKFYIYCDVEFEYFIIIIVPRWDSLSFPPYVIENYWQGEDGIRQASEERNSLTRLVHFAAFHEKAQFRKQVCIQK